MPHKNRRHLLLPPYQERQLLAILQGASVQGSPNFSPSDTKGPVDAKIVWQNKDSVPHTATSGKGPSDSTSGKIFDTKIINNDESSTPQTLKGAKVGDIIPYYCQIHPYMTAHLTVTAATGERWRIGAQKQLLFLDLHYQFCKVLQYKETQPLILIQLVSKRAVLFKS